MGRQAQSTAQSELWGGETPARGRGGPDGVGDGETTHACSAPDAVLGAGG